MPGPEDAKLYRMRAQNCLDIAKEQEGRRKIMLLEMAQAWIRLAEQAERSPEADRGRDPDPD